MNTTALLELYSEVDQGLTATTAPWNPCAKIGCCKGNAHCCKSILSVSISWLEMEAIYNTIRTWPAERQRRIVSRALAQFSAVYEENKDFFDKMDAEGGMPPNVYNTIGAFLQNLEDKTCPLLVENPADGTLYACGVHAVRPMVCRLFGQSFVASNGSEVTLSACDDVYEAALAEQAQAGEAGWEHVWFDARPTQRELLDLYAPKFGSMRFPLVLKPISFWIVDLTDESGLITNPHDVFEKIRGGIGNAAENYNSAMQKFVESMNEPAN